MKTNGLIKGLGTLFSKENRVKTIVVLGLLGIALILLSELVPVGGGSDTQAAGSASVDEEEMKRQVEEKLAELIGSIAGVGECKIMVLSLIHIWLCVQKDHLCGGGRGCRQQASQGADTRRAGSQRTGIY